LERPSQVFEEQQQLERVYRRRFEFELFIESSSRFIKCMDHDSPDRHDVGCFLDSCQRVEEERLTESFALLCLVYRQSGEEHDADRVVGQPFGNTFRALVLVNGANR
jgi:hypothetical protein